MIQALIPLLTSENMRESVQFYEKVLEFKTTMLVDDNKEGYSHLPPDKNIVFAVLTRDKATIMIEDKNAFYSNSCCPCPDKVQLTGALYFIVEDIQVLYNSLKVHFPSLNPPTTQWYGNQEILLIDNNGYGITFAQHPAKQDS